jgi:protein phosphatase
MDRTAVTHPLIDAFGASDVGRERSANEDGFVVAALEKRLDVRATSIEDDGVFAPLLESTAHLLMVADGVAKSKGGRVASGTAVASLVSHLSETVGCYYSFAVDEETAFLDQLERAVLQADARVREKGGATTMTLVLLLWPRAYIVHAGDSRGYYLRRGRLRQFTRDQSMADLLVDQGVLSEEQARKAGYHRVLGSALGSELTLSVGLLDLEPGDVLLLCTDGLTRHVPDSAIAGLLGQGGEARETCGELIATALAAGGADNVTVIVARTGPAQDAASSR